MIGRCLGQDWRRGGRWAGLRIQRRVLLNLLHRSRCKEAEVISRLCGVTSVEAGSAALPYEAQCALKHTGRRLGCLEVVRLLLFLLPGFSLGVDSKRIDA